MLEAVIWKSAFARMRLAPQEGLEVVVTGRLTTFAGPSKYQIVIETLEPAGLGALMALVEERKKKLAAEGLFDAARKQLLPFLPAVIGVVTSPTGAVIRDILHRLADRFPRHVLVWPVRVQGEGSAARGRGRDPRLQCAPRGRPHRAARSPDRRARRRLARGPVVVQRGDRGARRGREHDPADLRGRARDRRDADRFRRPTSARRRRPRPPRWRCRCARSSCCRSTVWRAARSPAGSAARRRGAPSCAPPLARCRRRGSAGAAAPAARPRGGTPAARADRQCADPPRRYSPASPARLTPQALRARILNERERMAHAGAAGRRTACACTWNAGASGSTRSACGCRRRVGPMSQRAAAQIARARDRIAGFERASARGASARSCKARCARSSGPSGLLTRALLSRRARARLCAGARSRRQALARGRCGRRRPTAGYRVRRRQGARAGRRQVACAATPVSAHIAPPRPRRRGGTAAKARASLFGAMKASARSRPSLPHQPFRHALERIGAGRPVLVPTWAWPEPSAL